MFAHCSTAQHVTLNEPESEVVALGVGNGVIELPAIPLTFESVLRVHQELMFNTLFAENVFIGNVYDELLTTWVMDEDHEVSTFNSWARTDDNRFYEVEGALVFRIEMDEEGGYEADWIEVCQNQGIEFFGIYGRLRAPAV